MLLSCTVWIRASGFNVTIFEKNQIGGLLLNAYIVENYPGFPNGIRGYKLCQLMSKQLNRWNIKTIKQEVKKISIKDTQFVIDLKDEEKNYNSIIIATGTNYKKIGIPGEKDYVNSYIFYEIIAKIAIIE